MRCGSTCGRDSSTSIARRIATTSLTWPASRPFNVAATVFARVGGYDVAASGEALRLLEQLAPVPARAVDEHDGGPAPVPRREHEIALDHERAAAKRDVVDRDRLSLRTDPPVVGIAERLRAVVCERE